jgi:DNA-binding winged helix-turn-helix (wHTH) protein
MSCCFAFGQFVLDPADRRLRAAGRPVEISGRYFDALALLVSEHGKLVSKDRFLAEVWRGIPVTDEALSQCVKTLRRELGDTPSRPQFIETVPKHGYRFIAPVREVSSSHDVADAEDRQRWHDFLVTGWSGTAGGAAAGIVGGLFYGFVGASLPSQPAMGAISIVLVTLCIAVIVALLGGSAVSFAIAAARFARLRSWQSLTVAAGGGGLFIGAAVKLVGLDAFTLLVGSSPARITGAVEGLIVGAAVGLSSWLATSAGSIRRTAFISASLGALAGVIASALGGRLLLGSLVAIEQAFPGSRLRVDLIGSFFGESGFGPVAQMASSALEGALFSCFVVVAMCLRRRTL